MSLSLLLREGTADAHRQAERAPSSASSRPVSWVETYAQLLTDYATVYEVLEESLTRHIAHALVNAVHFPALYRREAVASDLTHFGGRRVPSEAALAYAVHLRRLASERPSLLIAHVYTRYLGDLSGGQVLKRLVQRAFQLTTSEGIAFYEFPLIDDIPAFKKRFRQNLDALPLNEEQCRELVDEANRAFAFSGALLRAVVREPTMVA